ncbi:MAG: sulfite exporter TauE/SafE family protein [Sulfurovum sp.]|nr:sulfite exporter TauE/SafE family protein [Sulfurovum sp.]
MTLILIAVGIFIGMLSGLFGIGGGMILIPILLVLGFDIKVAIGISVIQMVFSSVYGSYLNYRKGLLMLGEGLFVGFGGFLGGFIGGYITPYIADTILQGLLIFVLIFALLRLIFSQKYTEELETKRLNKMLLFMMGVMIGIFSITLGIGGSIILLPLLVGILHYPLKKAVSIGLFFVVFSSISGFITRLSIGTIDFENGLIVALASLLGVTLGIYITTYLSEKMHKRLLMLLYSLGLFLMVTNIFF